MSTQVCAIWGEDFTRYDFGPGHPMAPVRLDLTARLCRELGVFDDVEVVDVDVATDEVLATVHSRAYVDAVRAGSADPASADGTWGIGTDDVPAFVGMHEASARIVAGSVEAARRVWVGEAEHGVNFTGGMHHAMRERAAGFCVYNDIAAAIQWLLDQGVERVAYVDVDVHHGDGVQEIFYDDPRVLTVSIHESGRTLFPGTGWPGDTGGPGAEGTAVNVALPPGVTDGPWLRAITAVAAPVVRAFEPQILLTQHGCDTHREDPLAHMSLTTDAQRQAAVNLHRLAHEVCDGRWVAFGGGGYDLVGAVPRAWTHLTAIAAHKPIPADTPIPEPWRAHVEKISGERGPERMGDLEPQDLPIWVQPWSMGYNPHSGVDRAIMAAREAVFPLHGLDVWYE
ncbi:acetoin utilization protein AcuC [Janibacter terrae]|uniref:Acetoin utilization protein AcuC n=1 Tax=Janibacter terrae TaxID=103817 RepID=A0ABZ2FAK6_9MICO|nr:acetoin utilization protein AcuC [Janibacter terrae]MBA4084083.1 acetoin utilization protein AcuC [Kytococcus sp.]HBO55299.1 acetoin utilization protein AcuC [Janibacter terrae]